MQKEKVKKIWGIAGKFGLRIQDETGQKINWILPRECIGHTKDPLSTTQDMALHMDITNWFLMKSSCVYNQEGKVYNTAWVGEWSEATVDQVNSNIWHNSEGQVHNH